MNYRKNQQIKKLAYALTLNFLCDAELRKALMKQS